MTFVWWKDVIELAYIGGGKRLVIVKKLWHVIDELSNAEGAVSEFNNVFVVKNLIECVRAAEVNEPSVTVKDIYVI